MEKPTPTIKSAGFTLIEAMMAMVIVAVTVAAVSAALGAAYRNQAYAEQQAEALGIGRAALESVAAHGTAGLVQTGGQSGGQSGGGQSAGGLLQTLLNAVTDAVAGGQSAQPASDQPASDAFAPTITIRAMAGSVPAWVMTSAASPGADGQKFLVTVTVPTPDGGAVTLDRVVANLAPRQ